MSEFCLDCWNKINDTNDSESKYILSKDMDMCEGCGEWKSVVIMERKAYYMYKFRYFILPFKIIYNVVCFVLRLLKIPLVKLFEFRD